MTNVLPRRHHPQPKQPPAILLRQAWRKGKRIRRRTIANLSKLPPALIDGIRTVVRGGVAFPDLEAAVSSRRALPHSHVAAILGLARQLGLPRILHRTASRDRDLALAAIAARAVAPDSKLATARRLSPETADSSLGPLLGLGTPAVARPTAGQIWERGYGRSLRDASVNPGVSGNSAV